MEELIPLIKVLAPVIVTQVGVAWNKRRKEKKDIEKIISEIQANDKKQTESIDAVKLDMKAIFAKLSNVENDTFEMKELHKHYKEMPKILIDLDDEFNTIIVNRKVTNEELSSMLFAMKVNIKEFTQMTLSQDFLGIDAYIVFSTLESKAKQLKSTVNQNKLGLKEPAKFMSNIKEDVIIPEITKFAGSLNQIIKKKKNDVRRESFTKLIISHMQTLTNNIISEYNKSI